MHKITWVIFFCLLLVTGVCQAEGVKDPYANYVSQQIQPFMVRNHIPGAAVTLYVHGKPYSYQYGYTEKAQTNKVSKATIFEVGSITKLMTSLLLAQELDYARVALTDSVKQYVRELPDYHFKTITLQSLATHTSGLPFNFPENIRSNAELDRFLLRWRPEYAPNREWVYSNAGMGLLGIALENTTQMQLNELYVRHILNPLGMMPIGLTVPRKFLQFVAQGYDAYGRPAAPVQLGLFPAAYGVKMTAGDMQKFLGAAVGVSGTPERIFYPMLMTQTAYVRLRNGQMGLGWQINPIKGTGLATNEVGPVQVEEVIYRPIYTPKIILEKTGSTAGFKAYMAVIPFKKSGISIMVNKDIATHEIVDTAKNILYAVNGL